MQIVPFEPAHLRQVTPQHAQIGFADSIEAVDLKLLSRPNLSFTALIDGRPAGCAGVMPLRPGVGQAWAVLSDDILHMPVSLTRAVLRELARIEGYHDLRRVQATVAEGHDEGCRWLAFLGFEVEGLLVNYGPGGAGDYWMYGKVEWSTH